MRPLFAPNIKDQRQNVNAGNHDTDNQPRHHALHSGQGGRHGFIGGGVNCQHEAAPVPPGPGPGTASGLRCLERADFPWKILVTKSTTSTFELSVYKLSRYCDGVTPTSALNRAAKYLEVWNPDFSATS